MQSIPERDRASKRALHLRLFSEFNASLNTRDTPRGLTLTLPDADFQGAHVSPAIYERLAQIAAVLRAHPDLNVEVEGHAAFSSKRAQAVREH